MIIFENGCYQFDSEFPDIKYDETALYYIPETTSMELVDKYKKSFDVGIIPEVIADEEGLITEVIDDETAIEKQINKYNIQLQIISLEEELASEDYKIIKCYEATMMQRELPYNLEILIAKRDNIRLQINELQRQL